MAKKIVKEVTEKDKHEWELISETPHPNVDNLIKVYKKDKQKARVVFCQDKTKFNYNRVVKFTKKNGDFQIVTFTVSYGISTSNIMYHRAKRTSAIYYSKKKFWYQHSDGRTMQIRPLTFGGLTGYLNVYAHNLIKLKENKLYMELRDKFFWLKVVEENKDMHTLPFNTIVAHKLFGYNDMLRYKFKCPLPVIQNLKKSGLMSKYSEQSEQDFSPRKASGFFKIWKECMKVLTNLDRATPELFSSPYFIDTCKMASSLSKKVNCSWGLKRLKEEHDDWSRQITQIVADCEPLHILNISSVYKSFTKFSGYKVLKTNREMIAEGMSQDHCVATYIDKVDKGECAIFHVNGFTLQVIIKSPWSDSDKKILLDKYASSKVLTRNQFKGLRNEDAPKELQRQVDYMIEDFNLTEAKKFFGPREEVIEYIDDDWLNDFNAEELEESVQLQQQHEINNLPF